MKLRWLNAIRWFQANAIAWFLLGSIYTLTAGILIQSVAGAILRHQPPLGWILLLTWILLFVPILLEMLRLPGIPIRLGVGRGLLRIYFSHEMRRTNTWIALCLIASLASILPAGLFSLWIFLVQFSVQRALFSIRHWRGIAWLDHPQEGAVTLLTAFLLTQGVQIAIVWLSLGLFGIFEFSEWMHLGVVALGVLLGACATLFEADSGQPWMSGLVSITAGTLAGIICWLSPWSLLVAGFFWFKLRGLAKNRLRSVENFSEDIVIP